MKKFILFMFMFFTMVIVFAQKYKITRYEQKSDALFICIVHTKKPVYIEHFFNESERKDSISILNTIEELVAELYIKADKYVDPEKFINRINRAEKMKTDSVRIQTKKKQILERIAAVAIKDSIARIEATKATPILNENTQTTTNPVLKTIEELPPNTNP